MSEPVKVGQVWRDNDPRGPHRLLKVLAIESGKAIMQHPHYIGRKTKIRLDRFISSRQTGYSLVEDVVEPGSKTAQA